jgi:hypothetical protein
MNEQIRKLGVEAGLYVDLSGTPWPRAMSAEDCEAAYKKFAELIVQECSLVADRARAEDMEWNIGEIIKEHFGVAE